MQTHLRSCFYALWLKFSHNDNTQPASHTKPLPPPPNNGTVNLWYVVRSNLSLMNSPTHKLIEFMVLNQWFSLCALSHWLWYRALSVSTFIFHVLEIIFHDLCNGEFVWTPLQYSFQSWVWLFFLCVSEHCHFLRETTPAVILSSYIIVCAVW